MNTYCIFCETVKAGAVARAIESLFDCRAISPLQVQHMRVKGKMTDVRRDLLPGYVFLYFEEGEPDMARLRYIDGYLKCLSDYHGNYRLVGSDEAFALMLYDNGGVLGKTKVYEVNQIIRVCEGVYKGVQAQVLKVDRRNMRMQIELPFAGRSVKTWVEYEIVSEVPAADSDPTPAKPQ